MGSNNNKYAAQTNFKWEMQLSAKGALKNGYQMHVDR